MRRIATDALVPTPALARALFHESGAVLFAAGERLGDEELTLLRHAGIRKVYDLGGEEVGSASGAGDDSRTLSILLLRGGGASPDEPAVVPAEVMALRRERQAQAALRAIARATFPEGRTIADPRGELREAGAERALQRAREAEQPDGPAWKERLAALRPSPPRTARERALAVDARQDLLARLTRTFSALRRGEGPDGTILDAARSLLSLAARDPDLAVALAVGGARDPSAEAAHDPFALHAAGVGALATAAAVELGYALEQVLEVGAAALFHDVGMARLPDALHRKAGTLDEEERRELERHPLHAMEVLRRFDALPLALVSACAEEHERADGTGYPKGITDPGEVARIIACADVLEALLSERPHRPARRPHEGVREAVSLAARKKLDPRPLRAILRVTSLFPLGSWVGLSDGSMGRTVRAGGPDAARPLLALERGGMLDLAERSDLRIAEADQPCPAALQPDRLFGF